MLVPNSASLPRPLPAAFAIAVNELLSKWPYSISTIREDLVLNVRKALPPIHQHSPEITALILKILSQIIASAEHSLPNPAQLWSRRSAYSENLLVQICALLADTFLFPYDPFLNDTSIPSPKSRLHQLSTDLSDFHLTPSCSHTITSLLQTADFPLQGATAHLISFLLSLLTSENSIVTRRAAAHALHALTSTLPPTLLAAFLPGITSALIRSLSNSTLSNASFLRPCLSALSASITRALPSQNITAPSSFSHALNALRQSPPPSVGKPLTKPSHAKPSTLHVKRDDAWQKSALNNLSQLLPLLTTANSPLSHTSVRVRAAFAIFLAECISCSALRQNHSNVIQLFRPALAILCGDDHHAVSDVAIAVTSDLLRDGSVNNRDLLNDFRALMRLIISGDELHSDAEVDTIRGLVKTCPDQSWANMTQGYIRVLLQENFISPLEQTITRLGAYPLAHTLVKMHATIFAPGIPSDAAFPNMSNNILDLVHRLGRSGQLTSLYTALQQLVAPELSTPNDFRHAGHVTLLLQAILRGAMQRSETYSDAQLRHVYVCTQEVLLLTTRFAIPTIEQSNESGRIYADDDMYCLKHCLLHCTGALFRELSALHSLAQIRPLGADMVLTVLMSLLRDATNSEDGLSSRAKEALKAVATSTRCSSERKLLFRHLNYIISRLTRNLEETWAGDVLSYIIGTESDFVSSEATALLEATLQGMCDSLAGAGDSRVIKTLAAMQSVLRAALRQNSESEKLTEQYLRSDSAGDELSEGDVVDIRKKLFYYCTDDIQNYGELTNLKSDAQSSEATEDGEQKCNPFESVASSTLDGVRDLLVGRPWNVRAPALACATSAVALLRHNKTVLLPHTANILPLLPAQFGLIEENLSTGERKLAAMKRRKLKGKEDGEAVVDLVAMLNSKGAELPVVTNTCLLIAAFAKYAGSFIRTRFVKLIYPKMRPLLRLASLFPTLVIPAHSQQSTLLSPPSHGAMSATDACLEAIASLAKALPIVLAPYASVIVKYVVVYFDDQYEPKTAGRQNIGHLNRTKLNYEQERWQKRVDLAETIIEGLKKVNEGDVWIALVCHDKTAPDGVHKPHTRLHPIHVRKMQ